MNHTKRLHLTLFSGAVIGTLLLDQVTKFFVQHGQYPQIRIIGDIFYFSGPQKNDGIAFGIDLPLWVQILGTVVILYLLLGVASELLFKTSEPAYGRAIFLGLIFGGGLGNLADRLVNGYVLDFIVLKPLPVFNVADVGITIGLILLFVTILLDQNKT